MPLNWNAESVKDWDDLPDYKYKIIDYTMSIGIGQIKKDNVGKWCDEHDSCDWYTVLCSGLIKSIGMTIKTIIPLKTGSLSKACWASDQCQQRATE